MVQLLKYAFLMTYRYYPLSVYLSINFSHFPFFKNNVANFYETWHKVLISEITDIKRQYTSPFVDMKFEKVKLLLKKNSSKPVCIDHFG